MKTYKNLYPQITDWSNLLLAWKKARRGKRYKPAAAAFEQNLGEELLRLQQELEDGSYMPGGYRSFTIHEPKRRRISAAPFRDRVLHHALCNVTEPIHERSFIRDCYANRKSKGSHKALDRCTQYMRHFKYVMHMDIKQFFPAIDHEVLKNLLARSITCQPTLDLCDKIIDSGRGILDGEYDMVFFPDDDLFAVNRYRGLPIGNLTSQFWSNVYLNDLDHFVKRDLKCSGYARYVDDFLLFADDKRTLHQWRSKIIRFLQTLRLTVHERRAQPRPVETGITFLGFIVFPEYRRLKRTKGISYRRHLKTLAKRYQHGAIPLIDVDASVQAWIGHAMHGNTWGLRSKLFTEIVL